MNHRHTRLQATPLALLAAALSVYAALTVISGRAYAADGPQQMKLATVDVNRIMNELPDAKQRKKDLEELSAKAKKRLEADKKGLEAMDKKLREEKLSEDSDEAVKFRKAARAYRTTANDAEEEIKREFLKVNKTLTEKVLAAVERYAKANQIDVVLDRSAKGGGPVLFGDPSADITSQIIKELNQ
jgi:Skp family chaperone for outer membrane proteins